METKNDPDWSFKILYTNNHIQQNPKEPTLQPIRLMQ